MKTTMNKIIKLLTLISFSLIITLSSCSSPKDTTSYRGVAKTKNGRFVKYKNRNPAKKFLAFKSKKKIIKTNSRKSIDQPSEKLASIDLNNDLIADNSESNYHIYLKKDNVNKIAKYTKPVVEDELLFEKAKTKKYIEKNSKNKSRDNSSVEASEIDDAKFDWVSLLGFVISIAAFGAILLATILGAGVFLIGLVLGVSAIILGSIGLGRVNKSYGSIKGKGFSIAAITIGGIFLTAITFFFIMLFLAFGGV